METVERPVVQKRPETQSKWDPFRKFEFVPEERGDYLEVSWDIRPVEASDVARLFGGVNAALQEIARAILLSDEKFGFTIEQLEGDILEIEVLTIEFGSVTGICKIAVKKIKAFSESAIGGGIIATVIGETIVHFLFATADNPQVKPTPLPAPQEQRVQAAVHQFKNELGSNGQTSNFTARGLGLGIEITAVIYPPKPPGH